MNKLAIGSFFWILLIAYSNAASPLFVSAITSALATIPFSGGPMTTGLVGAKLGIGTKLLYYLGYFGRKAPKPKAKKKAPATAKLIPIVESPSQSFQSMSPSLFNSFPPNFQNPFSNVDPSQLFQALIAQGVDPNVAMQAINYAGNRNPSPNAFASNAALGSFAGAGFTSGFPSGMSGPAFPGGSTAGGFKSGMPSQPGFPPGGFSSAIPAQQFEPDSEEGDDAESFFTFMQDMDENTCISRLICDIGRDPSFLGDFSENISSMVGSLKVPPTSRAFKYIEIMESGKRGGQCDIKFPECGDVSYEVVKNVAPSVSLPQNVNSADINF